MIRNFIFLVYSSLLSMHAAFGMENPCSSVFQNNTPKSIFLTSPELKGKKGEAIVAKQLLKLHSSRYKIFNDIIIKPSDDPYDWFQIDHLIISPKGIFVIETKHLSGLIYGNDTNYKWKQFLNNQSFSFFSPVQQNFGHIYKLNQILHINYNFFESIVVFTNNPTLHIKSKSKTKIIHTDKLISTIQRYNHSIIQNDQELIDKLTPYISYNEKDKLIFKSIVLQKIQDREFFELCSINHGLCPECDSNLILKYGSHGAFLGCSAFNSYNQNSCRYSRTMKDKCLCPNNHQLTIKYSKCQYYEFQAFLSCSHYPYCKFKLSKISDYVKKQSN